jgi:hypothetical protein
MSIVGVLIPLRHARVVKRNSLLRDVEADDQRNRNMMIGASRISRNDSPQPPAPNISSSLARWFSQLLPVAVTDRLYRARHCWAIQLIRGMTSRGGNRSGGKRDPVANPGPQNFSFPPQVLFYREKAGHQQ